MPETLLPATIRARVHEDAINRVTRFFNATTVETLNELFQNARRAGATRVDVTVADGEVTVRDDGHGIADPAALLAFGQTRWDDDATRREDPAGMGVYALARRPRITIRSRPRPADGGQLPAWEVHLTPEHFLGRATAAVRAIDDDILPFGTEVRFDDDKANTGNVDCAAQHFPLPVTCNGVKAYRRDFLYDAIHVETWRGIRIGVYAHSYHRGRQTELNFHGIQIEAVRLPYVSSMDSHLHVKADVVDCAELELVLPARKSVVETPFVDQLRTACRRAIYRAMLARHPEIDVPADVRTDALDLGVQLPMAHAALVPWKPRYADEYVNDRQTAGRTALPGDPIVVDTDGMPLCDQHALYRAAQRASISHRLCREETRYRGYHWYDRLKTTTKLTTRIVRDGDELCIEDCRKQHDPPQTCRPDGITFVLQTIDGDGTIDHLCIPADIAFGNEYVSWPEELGLLVTRDSEITPDELAKLMCDAHFSPSEDCEADSYDTQRHDYRQAANATALGLLASAEEATLSNLRDAVHRWVLPHLRKSQCATIRIHAGKPVEITLDANRSEDGAEAS